MTEKQRAILIAALRYFDEEFSPSGSSALQRELPEWHVVPEDLADLRRQLAKASICFVAESQLRQTASTDFVPVLR
ncbi:MAG: hypothetical protein R3C49_27460 [Planctomycetaceae bacterium]